MVPSPTRNSWARRSRRSATEVVIATKFGFDIDPKTGKQRGLNSRPAHIKAVAEASLKRLRTDHIDLFYQHRVDPAVPIEDVAGAVKELIARGQGQAFRPVRGRRADDPPRACGAAGDGAAERVFAVVARARAEVLPTLEELGIGFVPFSPLGKGFLTGAINASDDLRRATISATSCRASRPRRARRTRRWSICSAKIAAAQAGDAGADRAGLAARAEAVDRADPRHHQAASAGRESRRCRCRAFRGRPRRDRARRLRGRGAGRTLPRTSASAGRPLAFQALRQSVVRIRVVIGTPP